MASLPANSKRLEDAFASTAGLKEHSWWSGHSLLLGMMFLVATVKFKSLTDRISCSSDLHFCAFLPWIHQFFLGIYLFSELSHIILLSGFQ